MAPVDRYTSPLALLLTAYQYSNWSESSFEALVHFITMESIRFNVGMKVMADVCWSIVYDAAHGDTAIRCARTAYHKMKRVADARAEAAALYGFGGDA